jgi:hypothetical protein
MTARVHQLQVSVGSELYATLEDTAHELGMSVEEFAEWAIIKKIFTDHRLAGPSKLCSGRKLKIDDIIGQRENVLDKKLEAGWRRFLERVNEESGKRCEDATIKV